MPKAVSNQHLAELIATGQQSAREWRDELKSDFDAKHKENQDRRHALVGKVEAVENRVTLAEGRVAIVETKLTSIVGDNSGGSGLLHEIRDKVDALKDEVAGIKKTVEDTPAINKWVYGAMAVGAVIGAIVLALIGAGAIEIFKVLIRH